MHEPIREQAKSKLRASPRNPLPFFIRFSTISSRLRFFRSVDLSDLSFWWTLFPRNTNHESQFFEFLNASWYSEFEMEDLPEDQRIPLDLSTITEWYTTSRFGCSHPVLPGIAGTVVSPFTFIIGIKLSPKWVEQSVFMCWASTSFRNRPNNTHAQFTVGKGFLSFWFCFLFLIKWKSLE